MAKPVTMQELTDWVKKNEQRTWHHEDEDGNWIEGLERRSLEIKYLEFCLDTRDMKVFTLSVRGLGPDFQSDFREEFDGTVLDLLEKKLDDSKAKWKRSK